MPVSSCSMGWCCEKADCSACSWGCIMWLLIRGWDQPDMASVPRHTRGSQYEWISDTSAQKLRFVLILAKNKKNKKNFALTRSTANPEWPNASLSNRCRVAGGEERWIDRTRLPDPGQPLCADGWRNLPVLLRGAAWLRLGRRGHSWGGKGWGWHRRGGWDRRFTWWRREITGGTI